MDEYISIKEFAARVGVTRQTVYNRLDKDLTPFLQVVGSKKSISVRALALFEADEVVDDACQEVDNNLVKILHENVKTLQDAFTVLTAQLEAKDVQISDLNERLREAQELNRNSQVLLGVEKRGLFKRLFKRD